MRFSLATKEEIADLIFNSADPELNDLLRLAQEKSDANIKGLLLRIAVDLNVWYAPRLLNDLPLGKRRRSFLEEKVRGELMYHAYRKQGSRDVRDWPADAEIEV